MSDYNDILTAVKDLVTPIVSNTVIRKKVQVLEVDTKPIVVIATGPDEVEVQYQFSLNVFYGYPITVIYAAARNESLANPSTFLAATESIRDALNISKLSAVTNCFNLDCHLLPEIKIKDYQLSNFDVAGWELKVWVSDTRSS